MRVYCSCSSLLAQYRQLPLDTTIVSQDEVTTGLHYTYYRRSDHLDPSGRMRDRLSFRGYESGHMMYLRRPDLEAANEDIREFIAGSLPGDEPARY